MKTLALAFLALTISAHTAHAAGSDLSGTVRLAPGMEKKIGPDAVLYVIARPEGMTVGAPAAVKRVIQPFHFPLHFSIGAADSMMGGGALSGSFSLTARISQSGSATPATKGDLQSKNSATGATGGKAAELVIDEVRP